MHDLNDILKLIKQLRDKKDGCLWCQAQTEETLSTYTLEEAYELFDAISNNNPQEIKSELADLLYHVLFYTFLAEEKNTFTLEEIIEYLHEKITRRNPHVFDKSTNLKTIDAIQKQRHSIKQKEKQHHSSLGEIPTSLPALIRSDKIQEKAANVGFDWSSPNEIIKVLKDEIIELEDAIKISGIDSFETQDEIGDILFTCVNLARHVGTRAEIALHHANKKFLKRFELMEEELSKHNKKVSASDFDELLHFWKVAKTKDKK